MQSLHVLHVSAWVLRGYMNSLSLNLSVRPCDELATSQVWTSAFTLVTASAG